jgi:hypothetical protein
VQAAAGAGATVSDFHIYLVIKASSATTMLFVILTKVQEQLFLL